MDILLSTVFGAVAVLLAVAVWAVYDLASTRGKRAQRQSTAKGYDAEMAAIGRAPGDGGILGDLGLMFDSERVEDQLKRDLQRLRWRRKWLPWVRFSAWWPERRRNRVEFWRNLSESRLLTIHALYDTIAMMNDDKRRLSQELDRLRAESDRLRAHG